MKTRELGQTHLYELLDIIQLTESVALSIRGKTDEAGIFSTIAAEFARSENHEAAILLLSEDGSQIGIASLSVKDWRLGPAIKLLGKPLEDLKFGLAESAIFAKVIDNGETLHLCTADIVNELLPRTLARTFVGIMHCQEDTTILTPLKRFGSSIGVLAIFATTLPELAVPSVRNLAAHISSSLEAAARQAEQAEAERALREAEAKFSTTFHRIPDAMTVIRLSDGMVLESNDAFFEVTGLTRENTMGRLSSELDIIADRDEFDKLKRKLFEEGGARNEELHLLNRAGEARTCLCSIEPIEIGGEACAIFISTDITERKKTADQYRLLAEHSADVIFRLRMDDSLTYISPSVERLLGYTPEEALDMKLGDILTPESYAYQRVKTEEDLAAGLLIGTMELEAIHKDGRVIPIESNSCIMFDEDGQPLEFIGAVRDITERKRAEARAEHLNRTLLSIRDINQLIARAGDRGTLLKGVCEHLVGSQSCLVAWTVLIGESGMITDYAESGLGERFPQLLKKIRRGDLMPCIKQALKQPRPVVVEDTAECEGCFAASLIAGHGTLVVRLEHEGSVYGVLCVSLPRDAAANSEEVSLFEGVSQDIALGLYRLELERLREQAETALRESEEFSTSLLEKAPNPITVVLPDTTVKYVNPAFEKLTGFSAEEIIGTKAPYPWWPEKRQAERVEGLKGFMAGGAAITEQTIRNKVGDLFTVELSMVRVMHGEEFRYYLAIWKDTTEQKKAQEALRESEEKFSKAFHASPDALVITSAEDGRIVDVNDNYCSLSGYSRNETIGRTAVELDLWANSEDRKRMRELLRRDGRMSDVEITMRDKIGEERFCFISIEQVNIGGKPYYLSVIVDITEHKMAVDALRESEERWYGIFYHAPIGISIVNRNGRVLVANEHLQAMSGYSQEEYNEITPKDLYVNPADRKRWLKLLVKNGRVRNFPTHVRAKDGTVGEILLNVSPVRFHGEDALQITSIDVTEHNKAEQALHDSEEKFSKAFLASPDSIDIMRSSDGVIIEANDAFFKFTGYSREEIIGHQAVEFDLWSDQEEFQRLSRLHKERGGFQNEVVHVKVRSGELRTTLMSCDKVTISGEACKIFICRDITEREQAEEALRESEEFASSLLRNAPNPVTVCNPDTSVKYVNPSFEQMTGYSLAEIYGVKAPYPWWPKATQAQRMATWQECKAQAATKSERTIVKKNGEEVTVKVSIALMHHDGEFKYYQTNWTDISELKQAGEALRQERNRAQNYLDIAGVIMVVLDTEGTVNLINKKGCEILELEESDIIGKNWFDEFLLPQTSRDLKANYGALVGEEFEPKGYHEGRLVTSSGQEKIISWHNTLLKDENGVVIGTLNSGEDITERFNAEQALRDSEEKFSKAFHSSPDAISIYNMKTGAFADINNSFMRLTGYGRADIIGRNIRDVDFWVDLDERDKIVELIKKRGKVYNEEIHVFTKSGNVKSFLFSADVINIGEERCLITVATDITVRKRAENELRNSEKRFRLLSDNASDLILRIQLLPDFRVDYVSPSSINIIGYTPQEFYADPDITTNIIHPEDRPLFEEYMNGILKDSGCNNSIALRWIRKDGRVIWTEETSTLVYNDLGIPMAVQVIARDITERKFAEQALQESERKLNSILMSMDDLIYTLDAEGRYVFYRPERGLYVSPEMYLGKLYHEVVPPNVCNLLRDAIAENKEGKASEFECWFDMNGRNEYYVAKLSPILSEEGYAGSVAVVRNITTRKRSAEKMERLYEQEKGLRQELQKEIEKRVDFTRALVHELKTPLTPVIASSEVMVDAMEEEPWLSLARNIYRGALNLNNRVDELLDVARSELGMLRLQPHWLSPMGLFQTLVEEMSPLANSHGLSLRAELPDTLPRIWADEVRLRQVVLNLIGNACKHAYEGGDVVLRVRSEDGNMIVNVSDTGPGLAEKDHQKVFQLYYRREKEGQNLSGLGVGLALCKTIVELHNGDIWVESEEGKGATFSFLIPLCYAEGQGQNSIEGEKCHES